MFKIGDRVIYGTNPTGPDYGLRGKVTEANEDTFIVKWKDGEIIDYKQNCTTGVRKA